MFYFFGDFNEMLGTKKKFKFLIFETWLFCRSLLQMHFKKTWY